MLKNSQKTKIILFACHSTTNLKQYWEVLQDRCAWAVIHRDVYDELKSLGVKSIFFEDIYTSVPAVVAWLSAVKKENRMTYPAVRLILALINRGLAFLHKFRRKDYLQNKVNKFMKKIDPDIIISNTTLPLLQYLAENPRVLSVQVFHSAPYKHLITQRDNLNYDLLLLPSEYHRRRIISMLSPGDNPQRLKVVGWPRLDEFCRQVDVGNIRKTFENKLGLKPGWKNVLYAPTYDAFSGGGIFPAFFGPAEAAFEEFCRRLKKNKINLIVKLHQASGRFISSPKIRAIAETYDVKLFNKKATGYLAGSDNDLLWVTDVLISDVSGITTDYLFFNRPIIYIEPDNKVFNWDKSDIEKEYRAGYVVDTLDALETAVLKSLNAPDEYSYNRQMAFRELFYKVDGCATRRGVEAIMDHYNRHFVRETTINQKGGDYEYI